MVAAGAGDAAVAGALSFARMTREILPALGVGLGYREPFRTGLFLHRDAVDFLEITADHFFDAPRAKSEELDLLAAHFRLIPHGLNLSLGSAEGLNERYLEKFAELVERVSPPWWSEHIAFTRAGGREIGHLTPVPWTREALRALARNIARAQREINLSLILENISFTLTWPGAEMTEPEFLTRLIEETGCGLLLDVTNLYINSRNHGYDPRAFLEQLPLEQIVQLHFVGEEERAGEVIDSHASPTSPPIWDLLEEVLRLAPVKGAILERDDRLPPFKDLMPELAQARELGRVHKRWP